MLDKALAAIAIACLIAFVGVLIVYIGEIDLMVVSVVVRNLATEDLDATTVLVTAASGPDDIEAPLVNDPSGGLPNAFLGVITPGAQDGADYGFAIPFTSLNRVRVTVDLGDERHEPVSFTGAVPRVQ